MAECCPVTLWNFAVVEVYHNCRLPDFPLVRRRNGIGIHVASHGASFGWLWQEEQTRVLDLSCSTSINRRRWALQLDPHHSHDSRAFRLRVHGGQRGNLRYLSPQFRRWEALIHQPQSSYLTGSLFFRWLVRCERSDRMRYLWMMAWSTQGYVCQDASFDILQHSCVYLPRGKVLSFAGGVIHNGFSSFWWCAECGSDRVPNESGAIPSYPLPSGHLRACYLRRESISWSAFCRRYY